MNSRTVLFADDDVLTQWVMTDVLRDAGFDVVSACRGTEAMWLLNKADEFDLLIADIDLPDSVSGIDLGHFWRQVQPGRPVLYLGTERYAGMRRLDAHETFLAKPFSPRLLLSAIESALEDAALRPVRPERPHGFCHVH